MLPLRPDPAQRFDLLDGLRGIAAIAVMFYHYTQHNGLNWLEGAWVAVDLFFVLSGFVIAHSYAGKIAQGMSFGQFARIRLIRLGPLYLLGLAMGALAAMLLVLGSPEPAISGPQVLKAFSLNLFFLPYLNDIGWPFGSDRVPGPIFPLNDPGWTLFYEVVVNAVFFFFVLRWRKPSSLWLVAAAYALFLYFSFVQDHAHPGWGTINWLYGFPRVVAEFFAGALIFSTGLHLKKFPRVLVLAIVGLTVCGFFTWRHALLSSVTLVPLSIVLASSVRIVDPARQLCKWLGELSYPLYILHFPLHRLVSETTDIQALGPVLQTLLIAALAIALALLIARPEQRLRRWLADAARAPEASGVRV